MVQNLYAILMIHKAMRYSQPEQIACGGIDSVNHPLLPFYLHTLRRDSQNVLLISAGSTFTTDRKDISYFPLCCRMTIQRRGGDFAKTAMLVYTVLFWASGLILVFTGLWMLLDPKRNYILDLVNFSEDDPLLTFASYIAVISGCASLFVGFIGCCGAMNRVRCLLVGFILCLFTLFMADIAIGTLALVYRNKFASGQMPHYLKNLTNNRYNRDKWVQPLIDTIQFYVSS